MSNIVRTKGPPPISTARVKRLISLGDVSATLLAIWTIFWPAPYYPLVAACFILPVFAIGLDVWIGGTLSWDLKKFTRNPLSLATTVLMPNLALSCRALTDFNFLSWQAHLAWSLLVAACIGGGTNWLVVQVRSSSRQLFNVCFIALTFGYAAVTFADTLLDPFSTTLITTTVCDKYIHVGEGVKASSIWYNVAVAPSLPGWRWLHVRPDVYRQLHIGERACVVQGSGLFGIGWLDVRPCKSS